MVDPITTAIAAAAAGKAAESLTGQARQPMAAIVRRIKKKFHDRPADLLVLTAAQEDPWSDMRISELARALEVVSTEDPEFGRQIHKLWNQIGTTSTAHDEAVLNVFHGRADKVVQLRDIHGDLNIS